VLSLCYAVGINFTVTEFVSTIMTAKQAIKQLRHGDPQQRILAIKTVARARDRKALKQLAIMCEDDPIEEVRTMARKAGIFIRQELGELPANGNGGSKNGKPAKIPVSPADAENAQMMVNMAMTHQINGEKAKGIKALAKALQLDPNLRHDAYFTSLAENTTGVEGEEALQRLGSEQHHNQIAQEETQQRRQQTAANHLQEVGRIRWLDVGFDLGLLLAVVAVCTFIALFLVVQSAEGYLDKLEDNRIAVQQAQAEGRYTFDGNDERVYYVVDGGSSRTFTEIIPDPDFLRRAQQLSGASFGEILLASMGISLLVGAIALALAGTAHLLAAHALRGLGGIRYLLHRVAGLLLNRAVILFVLVCIGTLVIFEFGGGVAVTIVLGVLGVFTLTVLLNLVNLTGKAYQLGLGRGMIATGPGIAAAALLTGIGIPGLLPL
jgi:hypothetical protein